MKQGLIVNKLHDLTKNLSKKGFLLEENVNEIMHTASLGKINIAALLISHYAIPATTVAHELSHTLGYPFFDLTTWDRELIPNSIIKPNLINKYRILPLFQREEALHIGISDPNSLHHLELITFQTNMETKIYVVEDDKLSEIIKNITTYNAIQTIENSEKHILVSNEPINLHACNIEPEDDQSIIQLIKNIILDALSQKVSDIHFEPYESYCRIRFRQDGILKEIIQLPVSLSKRVTAGLKVMANLDTAEMRLPQDGHFKLDTDNVKVIDLRMSTCPTVFGETVVLRILDQNMLKISLDKLGLEIFQKDLLLNTIDKPQGFLLITGPTGSGKTATLYSILSLLNSEHRNIMTCEDPVEILLHGIQQVNIQPKIGFDFNQALRTFLRQDPDVIMVGEIRDYETAKIALQASETGHLVLSTLHANNARDTFSRLLQLGIPPYLLSNAFTLIIAQRLVRRLCEYCKIIIPPSLAQIKRFSPIITNFHHMTFYGPTGCTNCYQGYAGRIGVFEVLAITDDIKIKIHSQEAAFFDQKKCNLENDWNLEYAGFHKAKNGITSLDEIMRVI